MTEPYIGRFAPSPTGPLHEGSLLAAVASYLDAKAHGGRWLVRIEDVDTLRTIEGSAPAILKTLDKHGLHWDGPVSYQSERELNYQQALSSLLANDQVYFCNCSRNVLKSHGSIYPGFCRKNRQVDYQCATDRNPASHAIRLEVARCGNNLITFTDRILGTVTYKLDECGDFIIRRRDSLFAYQLAVVVDDLSQQVTHIVRGADLLTSTPWQIALQTALGKHNKLPIYAHLPIIVKASDGAKLSKQTGAEAINNTQPRSNLLKALTQLNQPVDQLCETNTIDEILTAAIANWSIRRVTKKNILLN